MQAPDVIDINRKSRASISTDPIDVLRGRIFASVIDHLCDANLREAQKSVGVWPWHDSIPVPNRRTFMMFRNGTMNFTIKTTSGDIFFGVWMFPGEVRIGFRLPPDLAKGMNDTVRLALDGEITPCPRIVDMGATGKFYDWIFRDGFADINLWIKAISDDVAAAVIADTTRSIMIHLYMSVIHAVITHAGLNSLSNIQIPARTKTATIVINFDCDEAQALSAIEDAEIKLIASFAQPGDRSIAIVTVNSESPMEFVDNALARLECGFTLKMGA